MLLRIRLLAISFASALALVLMLCLGAQNLNDRHKLNLVYTSTAPLPSGFLIGVSIVLGVVSGGGTAAVLVTPPRH